MNRIQIQFPWHQKKQNAIAFGIPILLLLALFLISKFHTVQYRDPVFFTALSIDFLLTVPLIHLILIRKRKSKLTAVPFFVAGLVLASVLLPKEHQELVSLAKVWVLPIIELTVLFLVGSKIIQTRKALVAERQNESDFHTALKIAVKDLLPPKVGSLLVTELAVIYYGLISWKKPKHNSYEYRYDQKSGTSAILGVFLFLILLETSLIHLLIMRWSVLVAWVLSIISLYTAFQVLGIIRSLSKRPIKIEERGIRLRYGILSDCFIPFDQLTEVRYCNWETRKKESVKQLSPIRDLEKPNVYIRVKDPQTISHLYGFKKEFRELVFHVDQQKKFVKELEGSITN